MDALRLEKKHLTSEIERITAFIQAETVAVENVVLGVSGGVDSDVAARLCVRALGAKRTKCITVVQHGLESKYIENARTLAHDIGVDLIEVDLQGLSEEIFKKLACSDPTFGFRSSSRSLDVGRGKCALRSFIFSAYSEHGRLVVGPSVRTEFELGYFLPLGDGASHLAPLVHLYKSEIFMLGELLGTSEQVRSQPPAAGFWEGDDDLKGIAVWLFHGRPVEAEIDFTLDEREKIESIFSQLTFRQIDQALILISAGQLTEAVATACGLATEIVIGLKRLRECAQNRKCRPLRRALSRACVSHSE